MGFVFKYQRVLNGLLWMNGLPPNTNSWLWMRADEWLETPLSIYIIWSLYWFFCIWLIFYLSLFESGINGVNFPNVKELSNSVHSNLTRSNSHISLSIIPFISLPPINIQSAFFDTISNEWFFRGCGFNGDNVYTLLHFMFFTLRQSSFTIQFRNIS